jgi:hypothetical protein
MRGSDKNTVSQSGRVKARIERCVRWCDLKCYFALIYARAGEHDLAIPLIERLLKTPGAVDSVDYRITINDLKYCWGWDPIRNDPRFQKLIAGNGR